MRTLVVVGASLAGLRAVETLRRLGFDGRLVFVGAEAREPYDRPPLSKQLLQGKCEPERTRLRKDGLGGLDLDLRLGRRALSLAPREKRVVLDSGEVLAYDGLLIATGASPRALPGTPALEGIHLLRTLEDSLAIREAFRKGPRVLVVGAGFIGAEVAASARVLGLEVTVVEPLPVPMHRGVGTEMGEHMAAVHRAHGVDLRCGRSVAAFEGAGRVERVRLDDGSALAADVVVVGIGAVPETGWLEGSGLELRDGVVCDAHCRTGAPDVVAAGDVARWHNPLYGEAMRVEHWTNAVEQGVHAAQVLLEGAEATGPFAPVPFVWSDQYDLKIQALGRMRDGDETRVVHGTPEEGRFVVLYGRAGRLVGVLGFSRPRQVMSYRKLLVERASLDAAVAAAAA